MQLNVPLRCTAITASHSSSVMLKIMRSRRMPATLTTMSIRPKASTTCRPSRRPGRSPPPSRSWPDRGAAVLDDLVDDLLGRRRSPCPRRSSVAPRSLTTTFAPAAASAIAIPRPIPRPAPVTSAVFPSSIPTVTPLTVDGKSRGPRGRAREAFDPLKVARRGGPADERWSRSPGWPGSSALAVSFESDPCTLFFPRQPEQSSIRDATRTAAGQPSIPQQSQRVAVVKKSQPDPLVQRRAHLRAGTSQFR